MADAPAAERVRRKRIAADGQCECVGCQEPGVTSLGLCVYCEDGPPHAHCKICGAVVHEGMPFNLESTCDDCV